MIKKSSKNENFEFLSVGGKGITRVVDKTETIHINLTDSGINSIDEHIEQIEAIRLSNPNDIIVIFISSCGGGYLSTTQSFINAIRSTEAHVLGVLEGENASAATMIALACDDLIITPYSSMMIHSASGGVVGTTANVERNAVFSAKWLEAFTRDIYKDFLSESEFGEIKNGMNIYLTDKEVQERLNSRAEIRENPETKPSAKKRGKKTT